MWSGTLLGWELLFSQFTQKDLSNRDLKSLALGHSTTNQRHQDSKKPSVLKIHSLNSWFLLDLKTNSKWIKR